MVRKFLRSACCAVAPLLALGACGAAGSLASAKQEAKAATQPNALLKRTEYADTGSIEAPLSTTDQSMLEAAEKSCWAEGGGNPAQFFQAFATSEAVRLKYSAAAIKYRIFGVGGPYAEAISSAEYYGPFPIKIVDYYYRPVVPSGLGQTDEYVEIEFNRSQSNQLSVDWTTVRYMGQSKGGNDLGQPFDRDGMPYDPMRGSDGRLLFNAKDGCWQFVADVRFDYSRRHATRDNAKGALIPEDHQRDRVDKWSRSLPDNCANFDDC